jgi:hypothetical protein
MGTAIRVLRSLGFAFLTVGPIAVVSCGTPSGSHFTHPSAGEADATTEAGQIFQLGDATVPLCEPATCASLGLTCGQNADGCGHLTPSCGTCTAPEFCGGGGPSRCGLGVSDDGGVLGHTADGAVIAGCVPATCAAMGWNCGKAGDGCGKTIDCGPLACPGLEFCGGGGPNSCGGMSALGPDGGPIGACAPTTCAAQGFNCGKSGDGCGNEIDCSIGQPACTSPQFCGGAGPNQCGGYNGLLPDGGPATNPCHPLTCHDLGYDCGQAGDGCGNVIDCSVGNPSCISPHFCGGAGFDKCGGNDGMTPDGSSSCVPAACGSTQCGEKDDGCGHLIKCPVTCAAPDICGGSGTPFQCGHCQPGLLCNQQVSCPGTTTTTLTGTVRAGVPAFLPGQTPDPVPNVLVYIPTDPAGTLPTVGQGYAAEQCPSCSADVGPATVSTYTAFDGTFTLKNVPVGTSIPVVIQLGRWRREVTVNVANSCGANSAGIINMPRNQHDGAFANIPLTAVSTGNVDALECILLKMGIDASEFTASSGAGRIHIYAAGPNTYLDPPSATVPLGDGPGAYIADGSGNVASLPEHALLGSGGTFLDYDQIMLPCWGIPAGFNGGTAANQRTAEEPGNLLAYANAGGHFFATHYSYTWLVNNGAFNGVAQWDPIADGIVTGPWVLNVSPSVPVAHPGLFVQWLNLVGALVGARPDAGAPNPAQVSIANPRFDVAAVAGGSVDWIDGVDQTPDAGVFGQPLVEHFTFDTLTPGTTQSCGHEIFSDFHVTNSSNTNVLAFPAECQATPLTPQERILEYMIWDLGACTQPPPPVCNPLSCADQHLTCGPAGDGCGGTIAGGCGTCAAGAMCVGGQCVPPGTCSPLTQCPANTCGPVANGCGGLLNCACPPGQTCGGGGVANQCGSKPDAGACVPQGCPASIQCGPWSDGCGNLQNCGDCPPGQTCGGAGVNGQCGVRPDGGVCVAQPCPASVQCGPSGDGCGNVIQCGDCPPGQTCGGGGVNGVCGGCRALTCDDQNVHCGPAGDGCGNTIDCGACAAGTTCGGGGTPSVCGVMRTR